jgi:hypothetical protein
MTRLRNRWYFRALTLICSIAILPQGAIVYGQAPTPVQPAPNQQAQVMSPDQLDSLVAPIALYPDPLLAQVLAASTYPLEIVMADRFVKENSNLTGQALVAAAGKQDWDPSVQALVAFPTVLKMMNQSLDWTTALGNAFLAEQADVMSAVQRMRMRAQESGKLQSNAQQQVQTATVEGQPTIVIQQANPEVIYVPTYDPAAVFGAPAYYPYPSIAYPVAASAISFGVGVAVGALFNGCCGGGWGWGWGANWGARPSLYVNNNFFIHNGNTFVNRGNWGNAYRGNAKAAWNHNPRYRGAVPYPNRGVANRYNGGTGSMRPAPLPAGNRPGQLPAANRPGQLPAANRPGQMPGGNRPAQLPANAGGFKPGSPGANRPAPNLAGTRPTPATRPAPVTRPAPAIPKPGSTGSASRAVQGGQWGGWAGNPGSRGGAFAGGSPGQARQFGNRGFSSMGGGRGGGGFHGGGGRGGGGRRR